MDEPLMRHIKKGGKVSVELEDWINKSLGRTPVKVFIESSDGTESVKEYGYVFHVRFDIKALTLELFPWSTASIDDDFYEQYSYQSWEDDRYCQDGYQIASDDFYPYTNSCNEVDYYRIKLGLNKIGKSYLVLSDYLARPKRKKLFND